jgi:outer membrane lipoprotein-sorting protein
METSCSSPRSILSSACASALLAAIAGSPSASPDAAAALLASFRRTSTLRAHFREEKQLSVLSVPLVSEGELYFAAPDRLAREVEKPAPNKLVIDGSQLRVWDGRRVEAVPLDQNPVPRLFVESFLEVLAGDGQGLTALYAMVVTGSPTKAWQLTLKPRAAPLSDLIDSIVFTGRATSVTSLVITERGGDKTTTTFSSVEVGRPFTPAEQQQAFGFDRIGP